MPIPTITCPELISTLRKAFYKVHAVDFRLKNYTSLGFKMTLRIAVLAEHKIINFAPSNSVGDKYLRVISETMAAIPVILPVTSSSEILHSLLNSVDGLLLTGGISNIDPSLYCQKDQESTPDRDPMRDNSALVSIKYAIEKRIPILGICRGFQEINVALGGTLHQDISQLPNVLQHIQKETKNIDEKFEPSHSITIEPNSILSKCTESHIAQVNSYHMQGIATLAKDLVIEAKSPDGLTEAFRHQTVLFLF